MPRSQVIRVNNVVLSPATIKLFHPKEADCRRIWSIWLSCR